jgi:hypothetical protein
MANEMTEVLANNQDAISGAQEGSPIAAIQARPRVQVDFSADAYQRLLQIKEMSQDKTNVDTIRNALRLYGWYLEKKKADYHLLVAKDDVVKEVELLL